VLAPTVLRVVDRPDPHAAAVDADFLPGPEQERRRAAGLKWNDQHYDKLSSLYEASDPGFLRSTGIVHFGSPLPDFVHVIPILGESYFRRSLRDADMIMDGLLRAVGGSEDAGKEPADGEAWLDFGGSHGRIAQIMASAVGLPPLPVARVRPHRGSPRRWSELESGSRISPSTLWARRPPLGQFPSGMFAGVYALSIWSQYSEEAALAQFDEMGRVLVPGGSPLVLHARLPGGQLRRARPVRRPRAQGARGNVPGPVP
jgi:hypothetical protein